MPATRLDLTRTGLVPAMGVAIRKARVLIGWSQRALAARAETSQAAIWRLETGQAAPIDLAMVERVLAALGLRGALELDDLALADRQRQRDGLHGRLNGDGARRLGRLGWEIETEVQVGGDASRGWIDLVGYRERDRSMLVEETKCHLPDMGGLQRRLGFYARQAWSVARELGWQPARVVVLVIGLDTAALASRLRDNRDLARQAFPGEVDAMAAWLADPGLPPPVGWTFALADPAVRGERRLRPVPLGARRRPPAYEDYADAARRLLRS